MNINEQDLLFLVKLYSDRIIEIFAIDQDNNLITLCPTFNDVEIIINNNFRFNGIKFKSKRSKAFKYIKDKLDMHNTNGDLRYLKFHDDNNTPELEFEFI